MGKSTQELKYKRLKVGHACYVCRSKKIKCDGLRPCMQCKARGRNCIASKTDSASPAASDVNKDGLESSNSSGSESDDESILFSWSRKPSPSNTDISILQNESWTSHIAASIAEYIKGEDQDMLSFEYPSFGNFVRWTNEPALPTHYSHPIEMPTADVQMKMIDTFFKSCYSILPIIPKDLFYQQLRVKGPLITPLLLNAIYCLVSNNVEMQDVPKASVFFNRAKKMVDDFLDLPRVSTVIALCLLSLYEPAPSRGQTTLGARHCRTWIYCGMASRMCLELGLNIDKPETRRNMDCQEIELRRRAFWGCYILDKFQSQEWERSWILPSSLSRVSLPNAMPKDDEMEQIIIQEFIQSAKLAMIAEEGLQIRSLFAIHDGNNLAVIQGQLEQYYARIMHWKQNSPFLEDFSCQTTNEALKKFGPSYNQICFYLMVVETLHFLPQNAERAAELRTYATKLVNYAERIYHHSSKIVQYEFLAHAVGAAFRVHKLYLKSEDASIAKDSCDMIDKCLKLLSKIQDRVSIPHFSEIIRHLVYKHQSFKKNQHLELTRKQAQDQPTAPTPLVPSLKKSHPNNNTSDTCQQVISPATEISLRKDIHRLSINTDLRDQQQPWLQALQDIADIQSIAASTTTMEDSIQQISPSSSSLQGELSWSAPMIPNTTFPFTVAELSYQEQSYLSPPSLNYLTSNSFHQDIPTLYTNEPYTYLLSSPTDVFPAMSNTPTALQQMSYMN
ncbi:hypothetical protein G6F70_004010 [Rhizopus microsporus]|nr:hypothetical protein G6F71_004045 [Rhizopus microsporus]KAG1200492.1 hypothetical protein G6F70_004010 [Rhizopus microsporus]KAG1212220.1 hypothetical protein G6F69_003891 [Rhizopus microsporus]KAG1231958.1 hypothetical protein G6F67_005364 [Rhizopus microsporus]KAG1264195.1 hypothetical protein G6F68_004541 [Rhizopus microsporus]